MSIDPQHRHVRVGTSCTRERVQEIRIHTGDSLSIGHRNQLHPTFVWSATEDGHHGWVPEDYIEVVGGRDAVARRDYDSTHLTAVSGETLEVIEQVEGYLLCRNAMGVQGWVPESCVEEAVEGP